jgi:hypothetical protein
MGPDVDSNSPDDSTVGSRSAAPSLAEALLQSAGRRLAFGRYFFTPAIVLLWLLAAYVMVQIITISTTGLSAFLSDRQPVQFNLNDGAEPAQVRSELQKAAKAIDLEQLNLTVTLNGKTLHGKEARDELDKWLRSHPARAKTDTKTGESKYVPSSEEFITGLLSAFTYLLMLLFLVGVVIFVVVAGYLGFFFLPFLLTLPFSLGLALFWSRPGHVLVLRPFQRKESNRPLRRIVARVVAGFGHTYTLADADIKVPWYVRVPILIGQLSFFAFHRRRVSKSAHVDALIRSVRQRRRRSVNWCVTPGRVFPVASTDGCWQECVRRLLGEIDVVLFDVSDSEARPHLQWELGLCRELGIAERVIMLVHADQRADTESYLRLHGWLSSPDCYFSFTHKGLDDEKAFQYALADRLARRFYVESATSST